MKKAFKYYAACWAVLVALYCVIVFAVRPLAGFTISYDARFWAAFVCTLLAMAGQLACAFIAFQAENKEKLFLSLPLVAESYAGAVATAICGGICMLIPGCPAWAAIVICALILAFSAVAVISAKAASEKIYATEEKVKVRTSAMRLLTVEAEGLAAKAKTPEAKAAVQKVYEAIRYSDPMSAPELEGLEAEIGARLAALAALAAADDPATIPAAKELEDLVAERARKCKVLK